MKVSAAAAETVREAMWTARRAIKEGSRYLYELSDPEDWVVALGAVQEVADDAWAARKAMLAEAVTRNRERSPL